MFKRIVTAVTAFISASICIGAGVILIVAGRFHDKLHMINRGWMMVMISIGLYMLTVLISFLKPRRHPLYAS